MSTKQASAASSATRFVSPALNTIVCGDAAQELRAIPDEIIDCIVTSPPYFRQRDYEVQGQLGTEKTPAEYVQRLMAILAECRRVLKPAGTMWLNIGDKYDGGRLLGIPWRIAIAMQDAGWILRSDIIWHKTNAMPHPTRSRPTTDHEYMFLFSKNGSYYYPGPSTHGIRPALLASRRSLRRAVDCIATALRPARESTLRSSSALAPGSLRRMPAALRVPSCRRDDESCEARHERNSIVCPAAAACSCRPGLV